MKPKSSKTHPLPSENIDIIRCQSTESFGSSMTDLYTSSNSYSNELFDWKEFYDESGIKNEPPLACHEKSQYIRHFNAMGSPLGNGEVCVDVRTLAKDLFEFGAFESPSAALNHVKIVANMRNVISASKLFGYIGDRELLCGVYIKYIRDVNKNTLNITKHDENTKTTSGKKSPRMLLRSFSMKRSQPTQNIQRSITQKPLPVSSNPKRGLFGTIRRIISLNRTSDAFSVKDHDWGAARPRISLVRTISVEPKMNTAFPGMTESEIQEYLEFMKLHELSE